MKLAIQGHSTRGKEVIELLEMMGGKNEFEDISFITPNILLYIDDDYYTEIGWDYIGPEEIDKYKIFTLEEFLEKYPFKVGDKVVYTKFGDNCDDYPFTIESMKWTGTTIEYTFNGCVTCLTKDLKFYKTNLKTNCKVNKEIDINDEVKPIFKVGDEIEKADGLTNSYIVTGVTSKYYSLSGIGVLPVNKQNEYILVNRSDDKEPEPKAPILSNRYDYAESKCGYVIPDGYEFDTVIDNKIVLKKLKPKYPKTYEECARLLDTFCGSIEGYNNCKLLSYFQQLLICRDAYWKIAGEEMGLNEPWKPDWNDLNRKYFISLTCDGINLYDDFRNPQILAFPTEEMRDEFYKNFKDLIEQCKELL